ncbi:hypothetical protein PAAG_08996 [Paracoccidioides lutzii Pb01]|uniref:Uncharacterized protein n=1 Tax=Paracoccidioides lutzii (strain ATCC MYA-826 / Pb01) TaxID=502779 RepID=C1HE03_PARBA|nr:hypothetical protein PAAG_08996 [Paracoccidioides lutzii Pb01]EEH40543.2 hypothetical protein PAAG_08996 [Paracoccidioides lutzii Pb01]
MTFLHFNPNATAPGTKFQRTPVSHAQQPAIGKRTDKNEKPVNKEPPKILERRVTSSNVEATDIQNHNLDLHINAGGNDWDSLRSLFYVDDSYPSDTLMSIATNKRSRDYEDDESNTSFGPQCSGSCSDSDSVVLEINSSKDMPGLDYKRGDVVSKARVPSAGDSKGTSLSPSISFVPRHPLHAILAWVLTNDLSDDDRIPISQTAPSMCSWVPSVGSDDESDSEGQTPPSPVLIEDGGVTIGGVVGYDPSWQPEHDLIPGCEELVREFHAKLGKVESHGSLKRRGRPPLRNRSKKARFTF